MWSLANPRASLPFQILILRSSGRGNLVIERWQRGRQKSGADLGKQTYFICTWSSRALLEFIFNTLHLPPLPKIKLKIVKGVGGEEDKVL